jgi:DNA-binding LacI/PurR family transcriptional regulator
MGVTIKDLARAAGVSHTTVSRALHDHPAISDETIALIKSLAASMGYVPSATARGLKTHRTRALGVIVSNIDDPFWSEVMHGVDDVLHPSGYSFFVAATHRNKQREKEVVNMMVQRGVDGVILLAPQFSSEQCHTLQSYGLPMAIVNNEGAGEYQYLIYNDNLYGIRLICNHLLELGHRQIAYLGNTLGGLTNTERMHGFEENMAAAGLKVDEDFIHLTKGGTPEGGYAGAQYLLSLPKVPTAIVCYNDYMAVGVYRALAQAGYRIPEDMSVAGFDDITISAYLLPPLTTLHQFKYDLGVGAARMMLEILETGPRPSGEPAVHKKVSLQGQIVIRKSTAPPRK